MEASPPSLRERNRLRAREEIAEAALALFLRDGFTATPVERVAQEAGVSVRTVFRHFPAKEDLFFHDHERAVATFRSVLEDAADDRPALDLLVEALLAMLQLDMVRPDAADVVGLLEREPALQRYEERLSADHHASAVAFLRGRLGDSPAADQRAELLAGAFMGTMMSARRLVAAQPDRTPFEHLSAAVGLLRPVAWP